MGSAIGFFTPVALGDQSSFLLKAIHVCDDYFYFGGKKWEVITVSESNHCYVEEKIYNRALGIHIALSILKVISIFTVAVPLLMLIGKAIARSKCQFTTQELAEKATVKIQSVVRGFVARKKFQRELAATKIQSHVKGSIARKEFLALKDVTIKVQRLFRDMEPRRKLVARRAKEKMTALKSLHEFVKSEKNHCQAMVENLKKMRGEDFKQCLKNPADERLNLVCYRIEKHIEASRELIQEMERFVEYLAVDSFVGATEELLRKRSFEELKKDAIGLSKIVCSEKFMRYLDEKNSLAAFRNDFIGMLNNKINEESYKSFDPFFIIGAQRMMRYPLLLENTKGILKKLGFELKDIDIVLEETREKSLKCEELQKFISDFDRFVVENDILSKESWKDWIWTKKHLRETFAKDLETYIEACDILNIKPIDNFPPNSIEALKQLKWSKLIEMSMTRDVKKAKELSTKLHHTDEEIEQLRLLQDKFTKALPWLSEKSIKVEVLNAKMEMCVSELGKLNFESEKSPANLPEAKRRRREELKLELRVLMNDLEQAR